MPIEPDKSHDQPFNQRIYSIGLSPGGTMTNGCGGGAGHGGYGGGSNNGTFGGDPYGSTFFPRDLGSQGGNSGSKGQH